MPCTDGGPMPGESAHERLEVRTQMLCYVMGQIENGATYKNVIEQNEAVAQWWKQHKKEDKMRAEQDAQRARHEAERKAALAKLTPQERAALGLSRGW